MDGGPDSSERTVTDEDILRFIRRHEDPCVTAGEVADEFGITKTAANYRLQRLHDRGDIADKRVGASAKIWYITG